MNASQFLNTSLYSTDYQLGNLYGFVTTDAPVIPEEMDAYPQACGYAPLPVDELLSLLASQPVYDNAYFSEPPESPGSTPPLSPSGPCSLSASMILPPPQSTLSMAFQEDLTHLLNMEQNSYPSSYNHRSDSQKLDGYFLDPRQNGRRQLLDSILNTDWYRNNRKEPEDTSRRSILCQFLDRSERGNSYVCSFDHCGKAFDRQDRALGHIRMHLGHRPFPCIGRCGDSDCKESFFCQSYLQSHIKRPKDLCTKCNQEFHRQQMRRHSVTCTGYSGFMPSFQYPHH